MSKEHPQFMLRSTAYIMCAVSLALGLLLGSLGGGGALVSNNAAETATAEAEHINHLNQARDAVAKDPGKVENWVHLGNLYFDAQMPEDSISAYKQALVLDPANPDVWTDMGSMQFSLGRMKDAISAFDKALQVAPEHVNASFNKGLALMEDGNRVDEAAALWRAILRRDPQTKVLGGKLLAEGAAPFLADKGLSLEGEGRNDVALAYFNAALSFTPTMEDALLHKAELLEKLGREAEARPVWQALVQLNPEAKNHSGVLAKDKLAR